MVKELADTLNTSPATVVLSWVVQRGIVVLTKSVTPARIQSNLNGEFVNFLTTRDKAGTFLIN